MNVTSHNIGDIQLFVNNIGGSSVAFSCKYETQVSINTDSLQIEQQPVSSAEIDAVSGTFGGGIEINYYSSNAFDTIDESGSKLAGSDIFMGITWNVNSLTNKVVYYVESCTIHNNDGQPAGGISIIQNGCYSKLLGVQLFGTKLVNSTTNFKYTSFVYGNNKEQIQHLTCNLKFCLIKDGTT